MITKTIQKTDPEYFIQFTDEELNKLNLKKGTKLDWKIQEDGSVLLVPWKSVEIDASEWDQETLFFLVKESLERDLPVNDIIVDIINKTIENHSNDIDNDSV